MGKWQSKHDDDHFSGKNHKGCLFVIHVKSCLKKMMGKWLSENDGNDNIRFMNGKVVGKKIMWDTQCHTQLPVGKKGFTSPFIATLGMIC